MPTPVTFADFGLPENIVRYLADSGITIPTPIQAAALADMLAGRDVVGGAPTGSGKTLAFGLPLVTRIGSARPNHPAGLVLAPTRELAGQIQQVLEPLGRLTRPLGRLGLRRRRLRRPDQGAAQRRRHPRRLPRPPRRPHRAGSRAASATSRWSWSTRPTAWPTWASCPRSAACSTPPPDAPDAAVLGHARRRRRRAHPQLPARPGRATSVVRRRGRASPSDAPVLVDRAGASGSLTAEIVRRSGRTIVFTRTSAAPTASPSSSSARRRRRRHPRRALPGPARAGPRRVHAPARCRALVATDVAARGIHVDDVGCVVHYDPPEDRQGLPPPLGPHRPRRRGRHRHHLRRVGQAPRRSRPAARARPQRAGHGPEHRAHPELPPVEVLPERATLAPQPNAKPKRFEQRSGGPRRQHRTGDARTGGPRRFEDRPRRCNGAGYGKRPNASRSGSNG